MNDIIIAARKLQAEGAARNIWIIDVDAHKGCGSAELVRFMREGRPEPFEEGCRLLTLSIHMAEGWPLDGETLRGADPLRAPLLPSDIEIPVGENDEASYCRKLGKGLTDLEALAKSAGAGTPDLAIVVDGADPYEHDGLASSAKLRLSLAACLERDLLVLGFLEARGIPSAWIMAGGYGDRAWEPPSEFLRALKR
jgi:acetoin utilization deacetylase AcuC-like enzyme